MIPKATHYAGFESYGQKPFPTLKPGQTTDDRKYYDKVSTLNRDSNFIDNYERWRSLYQTGRSVTPDDYKTHPRKVCFDSKDKAELGKSVVEGVGMHLTNGGPTEHWRTEYTSSFYETEGKHR